MNMIVQEVRTSAFSRNALADTGAPWTRPPEARGTGIFSARVLTNGTPENETGHADAIVMQVCAIEGRELWVGRLAESAHALPRLSIGLTAISEPLDGAPNLRYFVRARDDSAFAVHGAYGSTSRRLLADPVMRHLAASLALTLTEPTSTDISFAEFAVSAIQAYAASRLMFARTAERKRGGLAPWQQRRASELLLARIGRHVPIADLAAGCRLSVSHFVRAFRQSMGLPPHRWIVMRRIDLSKDLLVESAARSLAEIALACGFADQSHFTRTFSRIVGMTPGAWRRCTSPAAQIGCISSSALQ